MEVEKHWAELFQSMTEDDGRIRAGDERELRGLWVEDFFIKLLVFKERLEKRLEAIRNAQNDKG